MGGVLLLNRIFIYLRRNLLSTLTTLFLIVILSAFALMGVTASQGMTLLEGNLRNLIPPVVILEWEYRAFGLDGEFEHLTPDMITAISELSYVREYDLRSSTFFDTPRMMNVFPSVRDHLDEEVLNELSELIEHMESRIPLMHGAASVIGVNTAYFTEIQQDILQIQNGRTFSTEELETGANVVVISSLKAEENNLSVGDMLEIRYPIYDLIRIGSSENIVACHGNRFVCQEVWRTYLIYEEIRELEIVGTFGPNYERINITNDLALSEFFDLYNQFYLPFRLHHEISVNSLSYQLELQENLIETGLTVAFQVSEEQPFPIEAFFTLYDSRDFPVFEQLANEILPEGWYVLDTSGEFTALWNTID
jgi:hypothetical protein